MSIQSLRKVRAQIAVCLLLVLSISACEQGVILTADPTEVAAFSPPTGESSNPLAFFVGEDGQNETEARGQLMLLAVALMNDPTEGHSRVEAHEYRDPVSLNTSSLQLFRTAEGRMERLRLVDQGRIAELSVVWDRDAAGVAYVKQISVLRSGWSGRTTSAQVEFAAEELVQYALDARSVIAHAESQPGQDEEGPCGRALLGAGLSYGGYILALGCIGTGPMAPLCILALLFAVGATVASITEVAIACFGMTACQVFGNIFCE